MRVAKSVRKAVIQESVFARVFTALHSVADARYFGRFGFALRCAELRGFAAKISQTVEETVKSWHEQRVIRRLVMSETQPDISEMEARRICSSCVREPFLQGGIERAGTKAHCFYCGDEAEHNFD